MGQYRGDVVASRSQPDDTRSSRSVPATRPASGPIGSQDNTRTHPEHDDAVGINTFDASHKDYRVPLLSHWIPG